MKYIIFMKAHRIITTFFLFAITTTFAQLKIDAEIRPRTEYRHGFKTLFPDNATPALFVSQRTRLNTTYTIEKLNFFISLQDVRVWGDVPQLNTTDNSGLAVHQAWGEVFLTPEFSLKLGRQEVVYDDSRFFGNVAWAQQARSHDLAMFKYKENKFKMDLGLAFNQSAENLIGTNLTTPRTYKAMQYVWLHNDWNNFSGSFLFLNNGLQSDSGLKYSQTVGTHLTSKQKGFNLAANLYYQFGKDVLDRDLSAYLLGLEAMFKTSDKTKLGFGVELQSGNDYDIAADENNAFNPFYGTNHKFNGLMDYFYVGNHINSVGLLDLYVKGNLKFNPKSNLTAAVHNFSAAADINDTVSKQLGTEVDLVYSYTFTKEIGLKAGYSHMFASEGMEVLKNNFDGNTNNWAWAMVTIKPTLFTSKTK
ncbi:alginate export family protein [Tenacibaculum tangerinum]|uniref:Alginate export family protein n=1 Tax=Tenacibaculum tangerinum TaxID=3038772 RepID=A0ABY8L4C4_9FLAO|nr:alginate export family protein [Tenacibaculum tangerinum]WGH76116.1 alginate export family protein [Tenacibaculum tangerinum]